MSESDRFKQYGSNGGFEGGTHRGLAATKELHVVEELGDTIVFGSWWGLGLLIVCEILTEMTSLDEY